MRKAWKMPSHRNLKILRSHHPALAFIFRSWMPTSMYRDSWRAFLDRKDGWQPDSVKLAANPRAEPRERHPKRTEGWVEGRGERLSVSPAWAILFDDFTSS